MDNLNPEQRYAATFGGKHLLVLAGAGTGKTRTIIARAKHLIKTGVSPKRILILSFTRKAANEIAERIKMEMPETQSEGLQGSTFHSWCMSIIKNHPQIFPQANYTLLDEEDQESCFRLLSGKKWPYKSSKDEKIKPETILSVYSYMANAQCSLSDAIRMKIYDNAPSTKDVEKDKVVLQGVIKMYLEYKKNRKYIDYDDILIIISKYLKRNEDLRKAIAQMYDHILIDEMQDTNPLQYELLSSFHEDCHLFCVGDDAQSIYGFRGADFQTIHNFTNIVKNSEVCKLTINYRSTQEVLDLSNWVIEDSPLKYDKKLVAYRGHGMKPCLIHWAEDWEEANDIANHILDAFKTKGKKWGDNLVLCRSAWGLRKTEACLIKHKIPYTIFGGNGLMSSRHIRDIVAPMRVVANYLDVLAWSRYLQLWQNIGAVTAARIIGYVLESQNIDDSLTTLTEIVDSNGYEKEIYKTLYAIKEKSHKPSEAITDALDVMTKRLETIYKDNGWEWRKDDFPILAEVARKTSSIQEFIAEYVLDPKLDTANKDAGKKEDAVRMSTVHSAKGLEADIVYVINASTISYPTPRAILNGEKAIEEERRCLYVALTRAKDELRVYRDVHSIHINQSNNCYFLNAVPESLYDNEIIANNYFVDGKALFTKQIDEDIYSDFNLDQYREHRVRDVMRTLRRKILNYGDNTSLQRLSQY